MQLLLNLIPSNLGMQLLSSFLALLFSGIMYLCLKFIVSPYMKMQFYKKQGIPCKFFPLIGYFKDLAPGLKEHGDILHYCKNIARKEPKKVLCSNMGSDTLTILYDPALIKEFYLNTENYTKDTLSLGFFLPILGNGLLTSEGNLWKKQRKALSSAFHFEFIKSILPKVQATASHNLSELKNTSLTKVNIMDELQKITGEVVGKVFFGEQLNDYQLEGKPLTLALAELISNMTTLASDPMLFILGSKFISRGILPKHKKIMEKVKQFRAICNQIVQSRKKVLQDSKDKVESTDLLQLLLNCSEDGGNINDEEIVDQFVTFFLAGMDTTGHLLTMVVYHLGKYPEQKRKMIEELQMYYNPKETVTQENLNKLDFTQAFLKETLRMSTPVAGVFARRALKDHKLGDVYIKKGNIVNLDYFYNNYNPAYYDDVDEFKPERWMDKTKTVDSFAFTPFSAGPRNCIGQHLALNESKIILGEFLAKYDFSLQDDFKLKMTASFLYEPLEPILIDLVPREIQ